MKVLIVGGAGYLGPVIHQQIAEHVNPTTLDVVDSGWFLETALERFVDEFDGFALGDKRDLAGEQLGGYDVVIDLAAVSNDPMGDSFEDATLDINYRAAVELAKRCRASGVKRFIFASSCSIYGSAGDRPRREQDQKNPLTAYAKSKWFTEQELEALADDRFDLVALRFATACGWSPGFRGDLVLNDFVITAITEKKITVLSDGTPWRPLVHTKDIGRAVAWACTDSTSGFQAFNVGSNSWTLTIKELAESVSSILGVEHEIVGGKTVDKRSYRVNFDKFEAAAKGFLPKEDLESAVVEMRDRLTPHLESLRHFRDGPLIRLNTLRRHLDSGMLDASLRKAQ